MERDLFMSKIKLNPVEMTADVMKSLEEKKLIYRLCPTSEVMPAGKDETTFRSIYECDDKFGGHKLITVTVNAETFKSFGSHPDNEEFLLIGDPDSKPLYLLISYLNHEDLEKKVADKTIAEEDFILLKVKYNDPEVSFFTMMKGVPHGECSAKGDGKPGAFYVTESKGLYIDYIELDGIFADF